MSLWDHMKPVARPPLPTSLERTASGLSVVWSDGIRTLISAHELRVGCPCAGCVEEWSGRRMVNPAEIPADLALTAIEPVGNYALSATFTDGHATGIYSWATLRGLGASEPAAP